MPDFVVPGAVLTVAVPRRGVSLVVLHDAAFKGRTRAEVVSRPPIRNLSKPMRLGLSSRGRGGFIALCRFARDQPCARSLRGEGRRADPGTPIGHRTRARNRRAGV